jgi:hypothetical protein
MQLALSMEFEALAFRLKPICDDSQVGLLFGFMQNDPLPAWSEIADCLKIQLLRRLKKHVAGLNPRVRLPWSGLLQNATINDPKSRLNSFGLVVFPVSYRSSARL